MTAHIAVKGSIPISSYSAVQHLIHQAMLLITFVRRCARALRTCANGLTSVNFTAPHNAHFRYIALKRERPVFKI